MLPVLPSYARPRVANAWPPTMLAPSKPTSDATLRYRFKSSPALLDRVSSSSDASKETYMLYAGMSGYVISTPVTVPVVVSMVTVPPNVQSVEQVPMTSPVLVSVPDTFKDIRLRRGGRTEQ
jgi:hypothetical protein